MKLKTLGLISFVVIMLGNMMVAEGSSGIDHRDIFVGASARAVGMGSAFTAGPSANNGFLWNPSSLGFMNGLEVNMGGIPFSGEPSGPDQAFSLAASPNTLGLTDKNVGNLSVASWFNGWNNANNESTQIVLLGYGLALGEQASAGANLRYYQNNTPIRTNYLWSLDIGTQFTYPLEKLGDSVTVGMNLSELSNGIRENGELIESLPLAARFGTTYRPDIATLLSADIAIRGQNDVSWGERLRLHFGAERWFLNNHFGVRVGYTALTASDKFSAGEWTQGISFQNSAGQLDYAHVRGGELDQSLHWISATLRWGGKGKHSVATPEQRAPDTVAKRKDIPETDTTSPILMPKTLEPDVETEVSSNELQLSVPAISPNSDGVADTLTFRFNVRANDKWKLTLHDAYTEQVWEKSGTGSPAEGVVWNGMGSDDKLVPDGDYVAHLYIIDGKGASHLKNSKKVTVDLVPATVEISKKTPERVGIKTWDINSIANWKLEIFNMNDKLVERSEGRGSPPETIVLTKVPQLASTTYKFALSVKDIAGNQSVQQAQLQFGSGTQKTNEKPNMTLMVGSFAERRNANMLAENLQRLYPNERVKIYTATVNGRTLHRVTIGEFAVRSEASGLKQQIQESQDVEPILITPQ
ncbi:MAG: SPOR domain-containing protein [Candidatus Poribacteria bacterium]|nr:SPOR domain-containing protein [Candidatus Poribacteria bacterium]